jgi:hypothetical protein
MLRDADTLRNVTEFVAGNPNAQEGRRLANRPYSVLLIDDDPPDLACDFDPLWLASSGSRAE